jgi:uncharacterized membrane protein YhaH (DUF805 family)
MNLFLDVLKNRYATFRGRATRHEYWMFFLFVLLVFFGVGVVVKIAVEAFGGVIGNGGMYFMSVFAIAMLIPLFCAKVRRLHDQE